MLVRGPAQLLLPFFRSGARSAWTVAAAICITVLITLLCSGTYQEARKDLAQIVRQSAWRHALSGEPPAKPWPWDLTARTSRPNVVRLGLSAAVHNAGGDRALDRRTTKSLRSGDARDQRDPHLLTGDLAFGDYLTVTAATGQSQAYKVMGQGVADPHLSADVQSEGGRAPTCASAGNAEQGTFRLIIETIKTQPKATLQADHERKL